MLAIAAGAVLLAAYRALSNIRVEALLGAAESGAPLALGALAIATALASQRFFATRRSLRSRRQVAVVPADQFDARPEVVLSFAAQLAASERTVAGWLDRRASALRVKLTNDTEGRLLYLLEGPARFSASLRAALRTYQGVELREPSELEFAEPVEGSRVRAELVLARASIEPVARLGSDPDPLQPFAAAMAGRQGSGERLSVCVDLLPATGARRTRLRRRLRREARRLHTKRDWVGVLRGAERDRGRYGPDELAERRQAANAVEQKLREAGPLYEAQVLLCCEAPGRPGAKLAMTRLLAAFEPLAERNWFRVAGLLIPGLAFLGSDLPWRRRGFDRRLGTGFFRPARRNILTAAELAGFLKPPTVHCRAENVLRSGAALGSAPPLPVFDSGGEDLLPLGLVRTEAGEQIVGVRAADTFFSYVAGRSRYGKTELAIAQFVHLVRSGQGGLFLDPHADALERIRPYLTDPGVARRVVRIDLGPGASEAEQPGWNLFELSGAGRGEAEAQVEAVVDAFASALEWGERSTRAINLTTQAAGALAAIGRVLPAQVAPTIFQIPTLLTDERWRGAVLPFLSSAARQFWTERFDRLSEEAITPLTNMVDRLRASTAAATLLGQSESTYRVREAMDMRKIVLFCPGAGGTRDRLIANLAIFNLLHAAKGRAELAPSCRVPFWVFCDEIQSFDGAASGNLAALLEQSAKFGLRAVLLNQNPERLSAATLNALTTNRSHLLSTALNSHAAGLLAREWGGDVDPGALARLERFHFIAQVTYQGSLSKPFALGGIQVEDLFGPGRPDLAERIDAESAASTPRKSAAEVLAHLEQLDERIYGELRARLGGARTSPDKQVAENPAQLRVSRKVEG